MDLPAPMLVTTVEVGQPLPDLSPWRADGTRYAAAHITVRDGGVPVGRRRVEFADRVVTAGELAEYLTGLWHDVQRAPVRRLPAEAPFITVVVPSAMQRPVQLARCVSRLATLDYPSFEVIVVDNRPVWTAERAALHAELAEHSRVRIVCQPVPGASAARNRGIAEARGDIVAFTDDDIDVDPGWLAAIAHRFTADPQTDCVSGYVFPASLETPAQVWFENSGSTIGDEFAVLSHQGDDTDRHTVRTWRAGALLAERTPIYRGIFGGSGNLAVRASVLAQFGGFDESLGAGSLAQGGEDLELLTRLLYHGRRITMDPAVAVSHHHREDYAGLRKQMFGYGVGYAAALTALILSDARHLFGLARLAGRVARVAAKRRQVRTVVQYPARLRWIERCGLLLGPLAYLRSRRAIARHKNTSQPVAQPAEAVP
ncbi:glycosyltransferase [Allorhizocola rhizosphaerae]|uniref:glycosyltransferase n=1 Tax=Allorhizocola rhizosphaerae TaxID=1872709 RepID=UPI000E3CDF0D|nr:glycosyltransferase family 2 protein [Allorhizocola rhizosphaerae]